MDSFICTAWRDDRRDGHSVREKAYISLHTGGDDLGHCQIVDIRTTFEDLLRGPRGCMLLHTVIDIQCQPVGRSAFCPPSLPAELIGRGMSQRASQT
jgi:hypothetical protein